MEPGVNAAIIERLKEANHLDVIVEDKFCVSDKANTLALKSGKDFTDMPGVNLQYETKNAERTLQVDCIAYNEKTKIVSSYEIKRANGVFDAGKKECLSQWLGKAFCEKDVTFLCSTYFRRLATKIQHICVS